MSHPPSCPHLTKTIFTFAKNYCFYTWNDSCQSFSTSSWQCPVQSYVISDPSLASSLASPQVCRSWLRCHFHGQCSTETQSLQSHLFGFSLFIRYFTACHQYALQLLYLQLSFTFSTFVLRTPHLSNSLLAHFIFLLKVTFSFFFNIRTYIYLSDFLSLPDGGRRGNHWLCLALSQHHCVQAVIRISPRLSLLRKTFFHIPSVGLS